MNNGQTLRSLVLALEAEGIYATGQLPSGWLTAVWNGVSIIIVRVP